MTAPSPCTASHRYHVKHGCYHEQCVLSPAGRFAWREAQTYAGDSKIGLMYSKTGAVTVCSMTATVSNVCRLHQVCLHGVKRKPMQLTARLFSCTASNCYCYCVQQNCYCYCVQHDCYCEQSVPTPPGLLAWHEAQTYATDSKIVLMHSKRLLLLLLLCAAKLLLLLCAA